MLIRDVAQVSWDSGDVETGVATGRDGMFHLSVAPAGSFVPRMAQPMSEGSVGSGGTGGGSLGASVATLPRGAAKLSPRQPSSGGMTPQGLPHVVEKTRDDLLNRPDPSSGSGLWSGSGRSESPQLNFGLLGRAPSVDGNEHPIDEEHTLEARLEARQVAHHPWASPQQSAEPQQQPNLVEQQEFRSETDTISSAGSGSVPPQPKVERDIAFASSQHQRSSSAGGGSGGFASMQMAKRGGKAVSPAPEQSPGQQQQQQQQQLRTSSSFPSSDDGSHASSFPQDHSEAGSSSRDFISALQERRTGGTPPPLQDPALARRGMQRFSSVQHNRMNQDESLLSTSGSGRLWEDDRDAQAAAPPPASASAQQQQQQQQQLNGRTDELHKQLLAQEVIKLRKDLQELRIGHEIKQKAAAGNAQLLSNLEETIRRTARERDEAIAKANQQKALLAKEVKTLREELYEANSILEYNVQQQQLITYDPNSPIAQALAQRREFEENFTRNLREIREALSKTSLKELSASSATPVGIRTLLQKSDTKINRVLEAAKGVQVEERLHIECLRIAIGGLPFPSISRGHPCAAPAGNRQFFFFLAARIFYLCHSCSFVLTCIPLFIHLMLFHPSLILLVP